VDWFLLEGNLPGFAKDNFQDGDLTPWSIDHGTAIESDGVVTLVKPGKGGTNRIGNYLVKLETSKVRLEESSFKIMDGAGDFVVISSWNPFVPAQNQMYRMHAAIETPLGADLQTISIGIVNVGPVMAEIFNFSAGLMVIFENRFSGLDLATPQLFPIARKDVSDNILLLFIFDDETDLFSGAFSLNGGVTFQKPFTPVHAQFDEGVFADWSFDALFFDIQYSP
jgi:hypothetical protein